MMIFNFKFILILFFIISCATEREIKRNKFVDSLPSSIKDKQKLLFETSQRIQEIEEKVQGISGNIDEIRYKNQSDYNKKIENLETKYNEINEQVLNLTKLMKEQKVFLKEVLQALSKKQKYSKKRKRNLYSKAFRSYKKGKYKLAKKQLMKLYESNSLTKSQQQRVINALGTTSMLLKQNKESLGYFSELYSKFPKSGYNRNALLNMGKIFSKTKRKQEAKETFKQLIKVFPKSKQAKEARKLIK